MIHFYRFLALLVLLLNQPAHGQNQAVMSPSFDSLSLEELMNIKITVASIKELTPRQSPGIVTYITAEDIRNQGARDLMEVLRLVPGFEFGADVEGIVGLGIRGNWAHEGKVVLFIDGREMNESLYSTLQFGNHYPVENVERIEIIRGPGSALHGGFAAYAVINIITRHPKTKFETSATAYQSTTAKDFGRKTFSLYGGDAGTKGAFSIKFNGSESQRSHQNYSDVYGSSYSMQGQSNIRSYFLNAGGNIGNLYVRLISDNYQVKSRDEYIEIGESAEWMNFTSNAIETKYEWKQGNKFKLIPSIQISRQSPWSTPTSKVNSYNEPFLITTIGYQAALNTSYDFNKELNLSGGITWNRNESTNELEGEIFQTTGTHQFTNDNLAAYGQVLYAATWANIITGIRFNHNKRYENSFVPRIGITREFNKFHLKALYSRAFRAPSTQNIDLSTNIQPEYTNVYELEAGIKLTSDIYFTLNAFHITTNDPIVYYFDTLYNSDAYTNYNSTGTSGFESVIQLKKKWGGIQFNSSFYTANNENGVDIYSVPGQEGYHPGLAKYKINTSFNYMIHPAIQIGGSYSWISQRYGIHAIDETSQEAIYKTYPGFHLVNTHLEYRFIKIKGLSARFSVRNILDQQEWFIQPYNSNHAPLPGMQREYQLRITYQNF